MPNCLELILLSVVNWLHLLATVAWIGGMAYNLLVLLPVAGKTLEPPLVGKLMDAVVERFRILVYISIVILIATGFVMQFLDKNYVGFTLGDFWTLIIIIKHIFTLAFIIIGIYLLEGLRPKILKLAPKGPSPDFARLQKLQLNLAFTNLIIGMIILLLTGIAAAI